VITRFQALVARESLAEVYPNVGEYEGNAATVVEIRDDNETVVIECYGDNMVFLLSDLNPSRHLLALINEPCNETGSYNEERMEWRGLNPETNEIETVPLSY